MPVSGVLCPKTDRNYPVEVCKGCKNPCLPYPLIMALLGDRKFLEGVYSITELTQPLRIAWLKRKHDYFVSIDGLVNTGLGRALHYLVESYLRENPDERYKSEERFNTELVKVDDDTITLTGQSDLFDTELNTLYDLKTARMYEVKMALEGEEKPNYRYQINGYRTFQYPEAMMKLVYVIKDFVPKNPNIPNPFTTIGIIPLEHDKVKEFFVNRAVELHKALKENKIPPICNDEESWNGKRCERYCDVSGICFNYQRQGK